MRIIAGKLKGHSLNMSKDKNTRPLKDMARESVFNLLKHSNKISLEFEKINILDLYAGTGSFGLECLSRKAKLAYFVENNKCALDSLKKNIEKLNLKKKTMIFFDDVFNVIKDSAILDLKFDLIFCDPPFKNKNIGKLIELIFNKNLLKSNGIIILHRNKAMEDKTPHYFKVIDQRIYGVSKIIFAKFLS
tara:strand:- start:900 stop:1469 length:570 start_codon:yes stop_codon:yes gene_type:complete